ncbi:hypothetical protein ACU8KH_02720 [Lachancea thermotolerans]
MYYSCVLNYPGCSLTVCLALYNLLVRQVGSNASKAASHSQYNANKEKPTANGVVMHAAIILKGNVTSLIQGLESFVRFSVAKCTLKTSYV